MRNVFKFLMAGALIAGTVTAQEKSASVESVLKELGGYQGTAAPATNPAAIETPASAAGTVTSAEPAPAAIETAPAAAKSSRGWKFWRKADKETVVSSSAAVSPKTAPAEAVKPVETAVSNNELPAAAVAAVDVPATLEASRELYSVGEFEQAQRGFEAVIKKDPENIVARMYLRKILERDPRTTEINGMKAVTSSWKTGLVLRSYAISAEAATKMGLEKGKDSVDVTMKFPEVKFPEGASAVYQPKSEKLFVRNTPENLTVLEEILVAMDVAKLSSGVDQVEIEAKFVEVSEGTLEQLGFEWRTAGEQIDLGHGVNIPNGQYLFDDSLRGSPGNVNGAQIPFNRDLNMSSAGPGDWNAVRFNDTFSDTPANMRLHKAGSTPLDILITALDQSSGADVLSAPRVVTQSGKKAIIRAGEVHYFPAAYDVGGNEGTILHTKYTDFSEKLLGVELEVTPKVDGDQISMALNPKVSELLGWQHYIIAPSNSAYSTWQGLTRMVYLHDTVTARLPIFKRREIKTNVTIADGSTMGMGGLISENVEKYEDKVPVLGSLPLIGRLFRNEGERAVKRNLMIFVTAKKVEPTGRINTARSFE